MSPGAIHKTMLCEHTGDSKRRQNKRIDKHEKALAIPSQLQSAAAPGRHGRINPSRPSPRVWPSQSKLRLAEPGCLEKKVADEGPSGSGRAARDFDPCPTFSLKRALLPSFARLVKMVNTTDLKSVPFQGLSVRVR